MYTKRLLPAGSLPAAALGVLVAIAIGVVPACSSGAEPQQENTAMDPTNTTPATMDTTYEDPPQIDADAPKAVQTATFASG